VTGKLPRQPTLSSFPGWTETRRGASGRKTPPDPAVVDTGGRPGNGVPSRSLSDPRTLSSLDNEAVWRASSLHGSAPSCPGCTRRWCQRRRTFDPLATVHF
jgi:hypothetical protein